MHSNRCRRPGFLYCLSTDKKEQEDSSAGAGVSHTKLCTETVMSIFRHLRLCAYMTFGSLLGSSCAIAIKTSSVSGVTDPVSLSEVLLPFCNLRSKQASRDRHMRLQLFSQQLALFGIQPSPAVCSQTRFLLTKGPSSYYHDVLTHTARLSPHAV